MQTTLAKLDSLAMLLAMLKYSLINNKLFVLCFIHTIRCKVLVKLIIIIYLIIQYYQSFTAVILNNH